MNKKLITGVLSSTFVFSSFANLAFADDLNVKPVAVTASTQNAQSSIFKNKEIESIVRKKLDISDSFKINTTNLITQDTKDKKIWEVNFSDDKSSINVLASAENGEIYSFTKSENYNPLVKILPEQAKENALDFIKKMYPGRDSEIEEVTPKSPTIIYNKFAYPYYSNNYRYSFARKINGEILLDNYFDISVSPYTGDIISYETKWNDATYSPSAQALDQSNIKDLFKKQNNFTLKYVRLSKDNDEKNNIPVLTPVYTYSQKDSGKVDAVSGKLYKDNEVYSWNLPNGYIPLYENNKAIKSAAAADTTNRVNTYETIPEDGVMSKEKAQKIVFNILQKYVDTSDLKIQSSQYALSDYYIQKSKTWLLNWTNKDNTKNLNATVNAKNGEIFNLFYTANKKAVEKSQSSKGASKNKMSAYIKEAVETIFPGIKGQYKLKLNDGSEAGVYSFNSDRYINNIPYSDNNVSMSMDSSSNIITSINYTWSDVKAKPINNILDTDKIGNMFFDKVGFDKYLVQLKDQKVYSKNQIDVPVTEANLVYSLKNVNFAYIDAATGKLLDYNGDDYKDSTISSDTEFTDIGDSKYKNEIIFMNKMNKILETTDKFNPSGKLLKKDAVKWIVLMGLNRVYSMPDYNNKTDNSDIKFKDLDSKDPYYTYAQSAVESGIIDNRDTFNGDSVVTKEDVTKWIINALGMADIAKYSNMFKNPYTDNEMIPQDFVGYAALANFYNIFGDKDETTAFEPNKTFTRDEFIAFIYNTLAAQYDNSLK